MLGQPVATLLSVLNAVSAKSVLRSIVLLNRRGRQADRKDSDYPYPPDNIGAGADLVAGRVGNYGLPGGFISCRCEPG